MQNSTNKENLEWKMHMLEASATCLRSYIKTKDERFLKLYEELKKEADYWDMEAQNIGL